MEQLQQHRKPYSQEAFEANDPPARAAIKKQYAAYYPNLTLVDGSQMEVDILMYDGDKYVGCLDVERKTFWKGPKPPTTMHWLPKKGKYPTNGYYVMFNNDFTYFYWITYEELLAAPTIYKDASGVGSNADFKETVVIPERVTKVIS